MIKVLKSNLRNKVLLSFLLILLLASSYRLIAFFYNGPPTYQAEVAHDYMQAKNIILGQSFPLVAENYNYVWHIPKGAGWYYVLAGVFMFSNANPLAPKLLTPLVGIATIAIAFFLLKLRFNLKTAIFTSVLLAISPALVDESHLIWPPFIVFLPVVLFLYSVFKILEGRQKYAILAAVSIGLMAQFEVTIAFFYGVYSLLLIPFAIKRKYLNFRTTFYFLLTLFLFVVPFIVDDILHGAYSSGGIVILIQNLGKGAHRSLMYILGQRLDTFIWNFRSTFTPNIPKSIGLLVTICAGAYLYLRDKKIEQSKKIFILFLSLAPLVKFALLFFYPDDLRGWWFLDLIVVYCFLLGIILAYFLTKPKLKMLSVAIILSLILISLNRVWVTFKSEEFGKNIITQTAPVEYIYNDARGQKFNVISLDTTQIRYDFNYLFWWYGSKKYGYQPSVAKQKLLYYILIDNSTSHAVLPKDLSRKVVETRIFPPDVTVKKIIN